MKNILIAVGVIAVLLVGYALLGTSDSTEPVVYSSDVYTFETENGQFTAQYNDTGEKVQISLNGTQYDLETSPAASGAKYENKDGSVMFWQHQGEAILEINGEVVFENAKMKDDTQMNNKGASSSLEGTSWQWKETLYTSADAVMPNLPEAFVISFMGDGTFSATTDCNNVFGSFETNDSSIAFGQIASTKKACPDIETQEIEFATMLSESSSYSINDEGNLVFTLKADAGSMMFSPVSQ